MSFERSSGILLHPTSLPSRGGIGDFGPAAHAFVEFLASARQRLWQVLPLNPVGFGNSPYASISAFAGNPLLISLERLVGKGWLPKEQLNDVPDGRGRVDFESVKEAKIPLIQVAAQKFLSSATGQERARYDRFKWENGWWLEDFVLFEALRQKFAGKSWNQWSRDVARREPAALDRERRELSSTIDIARVVQFFFYEQWSALRAHCARYGIKIIGDVAIFVNYDSADVWTHPDIFRLNADLEPEVVAGVPPDAFSATGQRWGNPLYRWDVLHQRGYDWWIQRMRWATTTCDVVRLDHFRGFEAYWEIPAKERTAVNGRWMKGPEDALFEALRRALGDLPFIAEDLGMITPEVHALRQRLQIPGMAVMQFGFGDPGAHIYLPHKFTPNTVVYTGTHDNDTTVGWWQNVASAEEKRHALAYLGVPEDGVQWALIRAAEASVAKLCVIPLQDMLGLGSEARMNVPSQSDGNWGWRFSPEMLTKELAQKLALIAEVADRDTSTRSEQRQGEVSEEFAA
ncbi:MAG TPA: 4-alpha-glucanotransferase [Terriglobales bacterium]|nr:4-alpha-glucanotransferase [Terriglobales bacterium]